MVETKSPDPSVKETKFNPELLLTDLRQAFERNKEFLESSDFGKAGSERKRKPENVIDVVPIKKCLPSRSGCGTKFQSFLSYKVVPQVNIEPTIHDFVDVKSEPCSEISHQMASKRQSGRTDISEEQQNVMLSQSVLGLSDHSEDNEMDPLPLEVSLPPEPVKDLTAAPQTMVFKCTFCGAIYINKMGIEKHLFAEHQLYLRFLCTICAKGTYYVEDMYDHIMDKHPTTSVYICPYKGCRYRSMHKSSILLHHGAGHRICLGQQRT